MWDRATDPLGHPPTYRPHVVDEVLIVSKQLVSSELMVQILATKPANVEIMLGKGSWMTADIMTEVIRLLAAALSDCLGRRPVFLTADCFRAHMTVSVWEACVAYGIYYSLIPSKLTWALQPCDTHVFQAEKKRLRWLCEQKMMESPGGFLSKLALFSALFQTISTVLCGRPWGRAFAETGLNGDQTSVSDRVLHKLGFSEVPAVGCDLPSLQQLQAVFPDRAVIPIASVFGLVVADERAQSVAVDVPSAALPAGVPAQVRPWLRRAVRPLSRPLLLPPTARLPSRPRPPRPQLSGEERALPTKSQKWRRRPGRPKA